MGLAWLWFKSAAPDAPVAAGYLNALASPPAQKSRTTALN